MAKETVRMDIVNENMNADIHLDNEIERIFGKADPPKITSNTGLLSAEIDHSKQYLNGNNNIGEDLRLTEPLLEPHHNQLLPPLAGPEIDDLDGDPPKDATPYPGIDDGLLEPGDKKPEVPDPENGEHDADHGLGADHPVFKTRDDAVGGKVPGDHDEPDYPYDINGLGTRFGVDDRGISPLPGVIPDVNTYQQKKNLAQGMMDLALLSANANQLRYVLESSNAHPYYYSSLTFISLSIIIQVLVGIGLILNSRYDVNNQKEICKADKINNLTVLGIFLITIVNVFITSFSVASPTVIVSGMQQSVLPSGVPQISSTRAANFT